MENVENLLNEHKDEINKMEYMDDMKNYTLDDILSGGIGINDYKLEDNLYLYSEMLGHLEDGFIAYIDHIKESLKHLYI